METYKFFLICILILTVDNKLEKYKYSQIFHWYPSYLFYKTKTKLLFELSNSSLKNLYSYTFFRYKSRKGVQY